MCSGREQRIEIDEDTFKIAKTEIGTVRTSKLPEINLYDNFSLVNNV